MSQVHCEEIWKSINGYEGFYEISNHGNIRSLTRKVKSGNHTVNIKGQILNPTINSYGYKTIILSKENIKKNICIHNLVAQHFLEKCPGVQGSKTNEYNVDHIDNDKLNNHYKNLQWLSVSEHIKKTKNFGNIKKGEECYNSKLKEEDIVKIRKDLRAYRDIANEYNVDTSIIHDIIMGYTWKHLHYENKEEQIKYRKTKNKGASHPGAKLKKTDVIKIFLDKRAQSKIAKEYGVTQQVISKIKLGKSYKEITSQIQDGILDKD